MRNSELKQIASDLFTGFAPQKLQKTKTKDQMRKHLVFERIKL